MVHLKKIIIVLLFTISAISVYCQMPGIEAGMDSMISTLPQYPQPDSNRLKVLAKIFNMAMFNSQRKKSMPYCMEAFALSRKLGNKSVEMDCYYFLGSYYKGNKEYDKALIYLDSALLCAQGSTDSLMWRKKSMTWRTKGQLFLTNEDFNQALNCFLASLPYYEHCSRFKYEANLAYIYRDIAGIYGRMNNIKKLVEYVEKEVAATSQSGNNVDKAGAYLNAADHYISMDSFEKAAIYLDLTRSWIPIPDQDNINYAYYISSGSYDLHSGRKAAALKNYRQALVVAESTQHGSAICDALNMLCYIYQENQQWPELKQTADRSYREAVALNSKVAEISALNYLREYHRHTGNYRAALEASEKAMSLRDSLISEENVRQAALMEARFQSDKKQKEIAILQKETEVQQLLLEKKSAFNTFLLLLLFAFFIIGWLIYFNFAKEKKIRRQQLIELEKDKQLQTINAMLEGQEAERSRLAKEIHDGLGGLLSGVKLALTNLQEEQKAITGNGDIFNRPIQLMNESISEMRNVAQNLMPGALIKLGLQEAVNDFCQNIQSSTRIQVFHQFYAHDRKLSTSTEVYIYRIIQELVNNAVKHAAPTEIIVQVFLQESTVEITVEDNGKGFDIHQLDQSKGAGWNNIRSRVELLQGQIDMQSNPEEGSSIHIILNA